MEKYYRKKQKKTTYIIIFLALLIVTSIGYAIFTEQIEINGIVTGNANFRVYFCEAWVKNSNGENHTDLNANPINNSAVVAGNSAIIESDDTLSFNVNLKYPGDKCLIGTKIKNESSIPVKLNDFLVTKHGNNPNIKINYISLDPNTEVLQPSKICEYSFIIEWDENDTSTAQETVNYTINLDYSQYTESKSVETLHTHDAIIPDKELVSESIEILGNDEIEDDYTLYINETRDFKAVVKLTYSDGTVERKTDENITWTLTDLNSSCQIQNANNILKGIKIGTASLKAEFEKKDGTIGFDEKTINVINWTEENGNISNGQATIKVGDYIAYDHKTILENHAINEYVADKDVTGASSSTTFSLSGYTGGWRVLGISDGRIQLISENPVGTLNLKGQNGYINGIDILNSISNMYAQGKGADSGRSVNVEDINKITGYDPMHTGTGDVRAKGKMWEYGNKVTYFWKNGKVNCTAINGLSKASGYTVYKYYDTSNKVFKDLPSNESIDLVSRSYGYYPNTLTESSSGTTVGISTASTEYKLLFNSKYWLASNFIGTGEGNTGYGIFQLNKTQVYDTNLYEAINSSNQLSYGVRPVITLSSSVRILKDDVNNGTSMSKACIIK